MNRLVLPAIPLGLLVLMGPFMASDRVIADGKGADSKWRHPPKEITISPNRPPERIEEFPSHDHKGILLHGVKWTEDRKMRAWRVIVHPSTYVYEKEIREIEIIYPPLAPGELVPILGHIYRVAPFTERSIRFKLVEDPPADIAIQPLSWVIPQSRFGDGGAVRVRDVIAYKEAVRNPKKPYNSTKTQIWVDKIEPGDGDKGPVAHLEYSKLAKYKVQVRRGDILVIGDTGHLVRNVVPANPKTGVIGWVELDYSNPIVGEALAKQKRAVRLMPPR